MSIQPISFRAGAWSTSPVLKPTNTIQGDLMIAMCGSDVSGPSMPAGWTKFTNENSAGSLFGALWYKVATDSDLSVASYAITGSGTTVGFICSFPGARTSGNPISSATITAFNDASGTTHAIGGITTQVPGEWAVVMAFSFNSTSYTVNNSFTERYDPANSMYCATRQMDTPGAVGTTTITGSVGEATMAWMFGLLPGVARRFWIDATATPAISPTPDSSWEDTDTVQRRKGNDVKGASTLASTTGGAMSGGIDADGINLQVVIGPLGTGSLTGAFKCQMQVAESSNSMNARAQVVVRVVKPDGTSRGVAYAGDTTSAEQASEFALTTVNTRAFPRLAKTRALTQVNYSEGDYLVVEIGERKNVATTTFTMTHRIGESGTDLIETESSATDGNPWIEFADGVVLQGEGPDYMGQSYLRRAS